MTAPILALALAFAAPTPFQSVIEPIPFSQVSPNPNVGAGQALISADGQSVVRKFAYDGVGYDRYHPVDGLSQIPIPSGGSPGTLVAVDTSGDRLFVASSSPTGGLDYTVFGGPAAPSTTALPQYSRFVDAANDLSQFVGFSDPLASCIPNCPAFRSDGVNQFPLSWLPGGGDIAFVLGCSPDASFVVGEASSGNFPQREACLWDSTGAVVGLGVPNGATRSRALAVSADGNSIVGEILVGVQWRPALWSPTDGWEELLSEFGRALWMSADGSRAFLQRGVQNYNTDSAGAVWMEATGVVPWTRYLDALQVPGRGDWATMQLQSISDDGTAFCILGRRVASGSPWELLRVVLDFSSVGVTGCTPQNPNSSGRDGRLTAWGSAEIVEDRLSLMASQLPALRTCLLVAAPALGQAVALPGSNGTLCLTGTLGRDLATIQTSDVFGTAVFPVSPSAIPQPNGPVVGMPGETWHFQVWHRDGTTAPTSNTTSSISVTLM